jgi:hypothetical protein
MIYENDILLTADDDLDIVDGDFAIGESLLQEVGIILRLNSGELKSDPVLAPNIVQLINSKANPQEIEDRVRLFLARDDKNYTDIKDYIKIK